MRFRTYDPQWNRTGYSDAPQYPGQFGLTDDYPAKCHCGAGMALCGEKWWLRFRGRNVDGDGYGAWCANDHEMQRVTV